MVPTLAEALSPLAIVDREIPHNPERAHDKVSVICLLTGASA